MQFSIIVSVNFYLLPMHKQFITHFKFELVSLSLSFVSYETPEKSVKIAIF